MTKETTAVLVSGGVDSLYALWKLYKENLPVIAIHARFTEKADGLDILDSLCKKWNIPFHILDLRQEFQENVIKPFVLAYAKALTPNPCAFCNNSMKFGLLYQKAQALGATRIASGHYAQTVETPQGILLKKAADNTKDQSYFLSLTSKTVLQKAVFPLGLEKKSVIRQILSQQNIPVPLPKESQEICFVSEEERLHFIQEKISSFNASLPGKGKILLSGSEEDIALFAKQKHFHQGLWHYTEGQRKGLGIAWKEPLYVLKRDSQSNTLTLGPKSQLQVNSCTAGNLNFFQDYSQWSNTLYVQTRFRQQPKPAHISYSHSKLYVNFQTCEDIIAPGQVLAVYNENFQLLAGGILEE